MVAYGKSFIQQVLTEQLLGAKHCSGDKDMNKKEVTPSVQLTFWWKAGGGSQQDKYMNKIISDGSKCSEER